MDASADAPGCKLKDLRQITAPRLQQSKQHLVGGQVSVGEAVTLKAQRCERLEDGAGQRPQPAWSPAQPVRTLPQG